MMMKKSFLCFRRVSNILSIYVRNACMLQGRPYLAGSTTGDFPEYLAEPRTDLPLTITAEDIGITPKATAKECSEAVRDSFSSNLLKYGALLFRGFPLYDAKDFANFYSGLGSFQSMEYVGGAAVRKKVSNEYTSSMDKICNTFK